MTRQKLADARLDLGARAAEAGSAGGDQPVGIEAARTWGVVEVEADRGGGCAIAQQPRPGGEVGKIEQCIGAAEADLCGEDCGIGRTGPAGDDRSGIAEYGGAKFVGELVEVLVADGEGAHSIRRAGKLLGIEVAGRHRNDEAAN